MPEEYPEHLSSSGEKKQKEGQIGGPDNVRRARERLYPATASQELMQAHQSLITGYFIEPGHETFSLVRSHFRALQEWHMLHTKWHLENYQGVFYLQRVPSVEPPVQNMQELETPSDLTYLFWLLWYAAEGHAKHSAPTQYFSLQDLRTHLQEQWHMFGLAEFLGLTDSKDNRQSLIRALTYLVEQRYLHLKVGNPAAWVEGKEDDEGIYYYFTDLTTLLIMSLQVHSIELSKTSLKQLHTEIQPAYLSHISVTNEPLVRAWRNLLLGPIFLRYDDPEAFAALRKNATQVAEMLATTFGWLLEINRAYACIIHDLEARSRHTISFNLSSQLDQLLLLLCDMLRQRVAQKMLLPNTYDCILTSEDELRLIFSSVYQDFVASSLITVKKTVEQYFTVICEKMLRCGFIRGPDAAGQILILPTCALYAPRYSQESRSSENPGAGTNPVDEEPQKSRELWSDEMDDSEEK